MSATQTPEAPEVSSAGSDGRLASLAGQVDAMVSAASEPAAPASAVDEGLTSLDAELASLADEMVEGAVQSAEEAIKEAAAPTPVAARGPTPATPPTRPAEPAVPPPQAEPGERPAVAPAPPPPPEAAPPRPASLAVAGRAVLRRVREAALRLAAAAAAPLERRGPHVRQIVGYAAVAQLFFAACLWTYVLVVREAPVPAEPVGGLTILGEHSPDHGDGHGPDVSTDDPHQASPAKPPAKPSSGHAPPAAGGHASAEKPKSGDSGPKPGARSSETLKTRQRPGVRSNEALPPRPSKPAPAKTTDSHSAPAKSGGH